MKFPALVAFAFLTDCVEDAQDLNRVTLRCQYQYKTTSMYVGFSSFDEGEFVIPPWPRGGQMI